MKSRRIFPPPQDLPFASTAQTTNWRALRVRNYKREETKYSQDLKYWNKTDKIYIVITVVKILKLLKEDDPEPGRKTKIDWKGKNNDCQSERQKS